MLRNLCLRLVVGGALGAMIALAGPASAATSPAFAAKIAPKLHTLLQASSEARVDVLVLMKEQADLSGVRRLEGREAKGRFVYKALTETAMRSQTALAAMLSSEGRGLLIRRFYATNAVAIRNAPRALIERLAGRADVAQVVADPAVRVVAAPTQAQLAPDRLAALGDNIHRTGADRVWSELGTRGEGIVVAGADTGIDWTHPALKPHYRGFDAATGAIDHNYSWHDAIMQAVAPADGSMLANTCGYATQEPCDDNSHGTHTMGTMVGDDGLGNQVGMAPGARFIGCRNMDAGTGKPSTYLDCFEWFLAPYPLGGDPMHDGDPSKAPNVVNNSWGCPADEGCNGDEFLPALHALADAGVMIVAAAGNDGPSCGTIQDAPAHHTDEVFVVGAFDHRNDQIASFSSRGPSDFDNKLGPDLAAPGVSIRSSIPGGGFASAMWSGTSMASPHVVGAVALLWAHDPSLKGHIAETIARFTAHAEPKTTAQTCGGVAGSQIPNNTYGFGLLNVYNTAH